MTSPILERSFSSTLEDMSLLAQAVRTAALEAGCVAEELFALELAASEAGSNVVRHAYRGEGGHQVRVRLSVLPDELALVLLDEGLKVPEDRRQPNAPAEDASDPAQLAEGGRGIFLIHEVMDTVAFETEGGSNRLVMTKRRPRRAADKKENQ